MMFLFTVDQEFDTVSGFLLKRTKDMVNKYRQLLVREAQVRHLLWGGIASKPKQCLDLGDSVCLVSDVDSL